MQMFRTFSLPFRTARGLAACGAAIVQIGRAHV